MIDKETLKVNGRFRVLLKENDVIIERNINNTITTAGQQLLFDWLTDNADSFIDYIGIGAYGGTVTAGDEDLNHEITRKEIEVEETDLANNRVLYHVNFLPSEATGRINEIAIFNAQKSEPNRLIANFDLAAEDWDVGVTDITNFAEGNSALKVTAGPGGDTATSLASSLDLSPYNDDDKINLLMYPSEVNNLDSITISFFTDGSNYYSYTDTGAFSANGWNHISSAKSSYVATGTPKWDNISTSRVTATLSGGSNIDITYDSLKIITIDENIMFSRQLVDPAIIKSSTQELIAIYELQFTL